MSNELVTLIWSVVNAVVSVMLEVIPGLKDKWSELEYKPLILLGFAVVVPVALWALACFGGMAFVEVECGWQGALNMFLAGIVAFLANQTTFAVSTRKTDNAQARVECNGNCQ